MTTEGMYSLWYMPFERRGVVRILNDGETDRTMTVQITHAPLVRAAQEYGYFHAKWHRDAFLPAEPARKAIDWSSIHCQAAGS